MRLQKLVLLFLFIFFVSFSPKVFAYTTVDTDITENTTWTLGQSPYVVTVPVVVTADIFLTIEPGVVVKFNNGGSLIVNGAINAAGTSAEPIYFTSYKDDSVGGDTNEDEGNSSPNEGDWGSIFIESSTDQSIFNYVNIKYSSDDGLVLYNGGLVSSNTLNSDRGIWAFGSHGSFTNLTVSEVGVTNGSEISINTATISTTDVSSLSSINVYNNSSLTLKNAKVKTIGSNLEINIFYDSSASLDSVDVSGNALSDTAIAVFGHGSLNMKNSSLTNYENGLYVYNNSSASVLNSSITCNSDGVAAYGNSTLDLSGGSISCGNDGIILFDEVKANIDNVKVSNAVDAGIIVYMNSSSSPIVVTKSEITGNGNGFIVYDTSISAHQNNIHDNAFSGVTAFSPLDPNQFDFTLNYWGDSSGPNSLTNLDGMGDVVFGDILFAPWCKNESCLIHNPAIIVPGVLGTEIRKLTESGEEKLWLDLEHNLTDIGDEFMDPLQFNFDLTPSDTSLVVGDVIKKAILAIFSFDYTNGLINEFENQGYTEGVDLFSFPYDWRYGVSEENVNQLKQKITDVLIQNGGDKVDIVAHSTGGLLVKKYVMENPEDNYIDKAVFVGVPNTGAPKAVKALIQGDDFGNFLVADSEMKKISKNLPVAYDLLPSEQYYDVKGSYVKIIEQSAFSNTFRDLNYTDMNGFLTADHQLNAEALIRAQNLHTSGFDDYDLRTSGVDLYAIDGCRAGTIGKIKEVITHGFFGDSIGYLAPDEVPGDGTVPLESSTNLPINQENKYYALKGEHGKMLSQEGLRQEIVNILSGSDLPTDDAITQDISKCKLNGRAIAVYSPLSIDAVDQDGNHAGLATDGASVENNIPNADLEIIGEHKFLYLPTEDGQTYTINIEGTGTGEFTLTDATIEDSNTIDMRVFKNVPVTPDLLGQVNLAEGTTLSLDIDGDGRTDQTIQPTVILNSGDAENFVPDQEKVNDVPPPSNPPVSSGGRSIIPAVAVQTALPEEAPTEKQAERQKNVSSHQPLTLKIVNKQLALIPEKEQKSNLPKDTNLIASVPKENTTTNYKIIIGACIGLFIVLLIVKKL